MVPFFMQKIMAKTNMQSFAVDLPGAFHQEIIMNIMEIMVSMDTMIVKI